MSKVFAFINCATLPSHHRKKERFPPAYIRKCPEAFLKAKCSLFFVCYRRNFASLNGCLKGTQLGRKIACFRGTDPPLECGWIFKKVHEKNTIHKSLHSVLLVTFTANFDSKWRVCVFSCWPVTVRPHPFASAVYWSWEGTTSTQVSSLSNKMKTAT